MTSVDVETDELTHLDFDPVVPCERETDNEDVDSLKEILYPVKCDQAATWVFILSCCGERMPRCDEHKDEILTWISDPYLDYIQHGACGAKLAPGDITIERF